MKIVDTSGNPMLSDELHPQLKEDRDGVTLAMSEFQDLSDHVGSLLTKIEELRGRVGGSRGQCRALQARLKEYERRAWNLLSEREIPGDQSFYTYKWVSVGVCLVDSFVFKLWDYNEPA